MKAIAESIKRYNYEVKQIRFVNNSMRVKDTVVIMDSIERHLPNLIVLNISKNEMGLEGGKHLANLISKMQKLEQLVLADCNIGDRATIQII